MNYQQLFKQYLINKDGLLELFSDASFFLIYTKYQVNDMLRVSELTLDKLCELYRKVVEINTFSAVFTNCRNPASDGYITLEYSSDLLQCGCEEEVWTPLAKVFVGDLISDNSQWSLAAEPYVFDGKMPKELWILC